jgi:site-specific recombinase XerD
MHLTKTKKSPFYQIIYEVDGKRTTISTKTTSKIEATKFFRKFKKEILQPDAKESNKLLSEFFCEYYGYVLASKSLKYSKSVKLSFSQLLNFTGELSLYELNVRMLEQFITESFVRSQSATHLYYRTLKAAFSKAVDWEYLFDNPFKKIKPPKQSRNFPTFITLDEFESIITHTGNEVMTTIFTIAFYTGMRLGELANMKWSWIDFQSKTIKILNHVSFNTKSKQARVIPMHLLVSESLQKMFNNLKPEKDDFVFSKTHKVKFNDDYISKSFKKTVRKANLGDGIHFHTLRHSFASGLVQKGVSLYVIKELLGHQDLKTTQIYSHLEQKHLFEAIFKL